MLQLCDLDLMLGLCTVLIPLIAFTLQCGRSRRLLHSPNAVRDTQVSTRQTQGAARPPPAAPAPVPTKSKKGVLSRLFRRASTNDKSLPSVVPVENVTNVNADISKEEANTPLHILQKPADANFWADIIKKNSERQKKKLAEEKATQEDTITAIDEESTKQSDRHQSKRSRKSQKKSRLSEVGHKSEVTDDEKKTRKKSEPSEEDKKSAYSVTTKSEYSNMEKKSRREKDKKSRRKHEDSSSDSTRAHDHRCRHKSQRRHRNRRSRPHADEGSHHSRYADPSMRRRNTKSKRRPDTGLTAPNYVQTFGGNEKPRALPQIPQGGPPDRGQRPVAGASKERIMAAVH